MLSSCALPLFRALSLSFACSLSERSLRICQLRLRCYVQCSTRRDSNVFPHSHSYSSIHALLLLLSRSHTRARTHTMCVVAVFEYCFWRYSYNFGLSLARCTYVRMRVCTCVCVWFRHCGLPRNSKTQLRVQCDEVRRAQRQRFSIDFVFRASFPIRFCSVCARVYLWLHLCVRCVYI